MLLDAIPTTAMRGTDSAALASVATEARLAELDAANLPASVDAIPTTAMRGTDNAATAANLATVDTNVDAILVDTGTTLDTKLNNLDLGIIYGAAATGTLSTTQCTSDLTGYADSELVGRAIIFTGGTADGQASDITAYASASGLLTFTAIPTVPVNLDSFKIV